MLHSQHLPADGLRPGVTCHNGSDSRTDGPCTYSKVNTVYLMCVGSHGQAKGTSQTKVCQLEIVVGAVYEQVLGLEVPVQHPAQQPAC